MGVAATSQWSRRSPTALTAPRLRRTPERPPCAGRPPSQALIADAPARPGRPPDPLRLPLRADGRVDGGGVVNNGAAHGCGGRGNKAVRGVRGRDDAAVRSMMSVSPSTSYSHGAPAPAAVVDDGWPPSRRRRPSDGETVTAGLALPRRAAERRLRCSFFWWWAEQRKESSGTTGSFSGSVSSVFCGAVPDQGPSERFATLRGAQCSGNSNEKSMQRWFVLPSGQPQRCSKRARALK